MVRRSERLGMPKLFESSRVSKWYEKDIYVRVEKYFKRFFPHEMVLVSKAEAFPLRMSQNKDRLS